MLGKISLIFLFVFCFSAETKAGIYSRGKFDFVASFDNVAITKFDLDNLMQINQHDKNLKNRSEEKYRETLDKYIDLLVMDKIIKKYSLTPSEKKEEEMEAFFADVFKTKLSVEEFCKQNGIEHAFFLRYLAINYLWLRFVSDNVAGGIKIDESYVDQYVELNLGKNSGPIEYNLSEITLYYKNDAEHEKAIEVLKKIHRDLRAKNSKSFIKRVKKYSQSSTKDNDGFLGKFLIDDLSREAADKIKDVKVGDVSDIMCVEKSFNAGSCFIFRVNDTRVATALGDADRQKIKAYIKNRKIEEKVKSLIEKTRAESVIRVWEQ
jgi:hypothetical protein